MSYLSSAIEHFKHTEPFWHPGVLFFSAMFASSMKESKENFVQIGEIEPEIMTELLRFMYTGQVDLLAAADMYHLDILKSMCGKALIETLSLQNLPDILKILDRHETYHSLLESTLEFLAYNGKEVADLENFDDFIKQLSPPLLAKISRAALRKC
ncbi:hypothetical protein TSAR_013221 [Trichomalopsis sarcophagae]|uniref:BTB domain-containing protein n=1 Tax=Trichomalopsis sarcophagae TaxID=543379 RepID=A0A232FJA3_9HYME|nr:hypothetical protein TSAR_013221 [Trichomalopsis sarcophagae]